MSDYTLLIDLLVVLGSATLIATVFHFLRLPVIVGFLSAGLIVGPHGLALISEAPRAQTLTEIGAVLLLFTIGLEFSFERLKKMSKTLISLGLSQVLMTALLFTSISYFLFGFGLNLSLFIGMVASLSSTAIVFKLLEDQGDVESPYGRVAISILIFQDLAAIPMILAVPLLASQVGESSLGSISASVWVYRSLIAVGSIWIGSRVIIPFVLDRVATTKNRELFFFCVLFICFGFAALMHELGTSLSLGAFLAGVLISESPYGKQVTADFHPLRDNFLSFFFIAVGMLINPSFIAANWPMVLLCTLVLVLGKALVLSTVCLVNKLSLPVSILTSALLFQVGEFSLILADHGFRIGVITGDQLQMIICVAVVTLGLTPVLFRWAPKFTTRTLYREMLKLEAKDAVSKDDKSGHAIIIGFGISGQNVASAFQSLKLPYKVVDMNNKAVKKFMAQGEPIIFGDASRNQILESLNIHEARVIILTVSGRSMLDSVMHSVRRVRPDVPIVVRANYLRDIDQIRDAHGEFVVGELETSVEILARALKHFGVDHHEIHKFVTKTRGSMKERYEQLSESIRKDFELPTWEALSAIRPLVVKRTDKAVGKSLEQLHLRRSTGATIVVIYRNERGGFVPEPRDVIEDKDVLYLIGEDSAWERAREMVQNGSINSSEMSPQLSP